MWPDVPLSRDPIRHTTLRRSPVACGCVQESAWTSSLDFLRGSSVCGCERLQSIMMMECCVRQRSSKGWSEAHVPRTRPRARVNRFRISVPQKKIRVNGRSPARATPGTRCDAMCKSLRRGLHEEASPVLPLLRRPRAHAHEHVRNEAFFLNDEGSKPPAVLLRRNRHESMLPRAATRLPGGNERSRLCFVKLSQRIPLCRPSQAAFAQSWTSSCNR